MVLHKLGDLKQKLQSMQYLQGLFLQSEKYSKTMLRYFNFDASFKLQWCRARDLFGSQISVTQEGLNCEPLAYEVVTWWHSGLGNYFVCKRFAVQTLLWSLGFVIQINLKHDIIAAWNMARSWSIST